MFQPVSSRVSFPEIEERVLKLWREGDTFNRSVANRRGGPSFTLYEGPPTANGRPGIHHVLSRVFKDVIPRYKTMKGYHAPRRAGWDTHGLPVELEVEKELGLTNKKAIEEYGIEKFNARCRQSVWSYLKEWNSLTERIAFWIDLEHPYITMDNDYIESCWWALKQMWDKGLIYQGYRVTPHCPRCGTSLSSHEVALGYKDDTVDPSIYIKFKVATSLYSQPGFLDKLRALYGNREADFAQWLLNLSSGKDVYLMAWTTTPWTLPGNTALAVAGPAEYAVVEVADGFLILASARLPYTGLGEAPVRAKVRGSDLVDLRYEPLYNPFDFRVPVANMHLQEKGGEPSHNIIWKETGSFNYPVIATDFVSMEDGTGIVHIAPAFGEVDYDAGMAFGLDFVQPVDLQGRMTGSYPFAGKFVKDADPLIMSDLKSRGLLYRRETIKHTYPFCWRCGTPLLYYAKQSWYIKTTTVKDKLISGNREINWYPEHIKSGRFGDWLQNNVDWAFSRERYWGTPIPIWECESCDKQECIGSVGEIRGKAGFSGFREPLDLHRPFVDEVTYDCPSCKGKMRRLTDVIDCWFDSGAMPVAQLHYPFENKTMFEDGRFPADYICEAVDQTRGWFYSLHAISTLLFDRPCFKNVICLGLILDAKGEKMSKSRRNVIEPQAVIDKYGADALRWYCLTAAPPGNVRRFSDKQVAEIARRFFLTLWNVYSFFVTYANIDRYVPGSQQVDQAPELDRWIISELHQLVVEVDAALEGYDPTDAGRKMENFVDFLSNWYVRRSRRRFWKSESDTDKASAYNTLYECLVTLAKLMAPFAPFLAEELYQNLVCSVLPVHPEGPEAPDSIHLTDFPKADKGRIDAELSANVRLVMRVSSLGRAARSQAGIKVRQPLARLFVRASPAQRSTLKRLESQILEEVNVKKLEVVDTLPEARPEKWPVAEESGVTVMLDTDITPELQAEGMSRELVHRIQTMRKTAGFDIADYIVTCYDGDSGITGVIEKYAQYIKQETLTRELVAGTPPEGAYTETHQMDGRNILLGVKKVE